MAVSALAVGIGGVVGAIARYGVGVAIEGRARDTLAVNTLGSFLLGVVLGSPVDGALVLGIGVGFCGAFTTFSSFAVETVRLTEDGHAALAAINAVGTLALAVIAVLVGISLGGLL